MRWGGRVKILRLAYFNIKKHKAESISIVLLITISMALLCSSVGGVQAIQNVFGNLVKEYHCVENHFLIQNGDYHEQYDEVIQNVEEVTRFEHVDCITSYYTSYLDEEGKEIFQYLMLINRENEEKIEDFRPESSLSREEQEKLPHAIIVPFYVKDTLGKEIGDTFTMVYNGKQYPFTIAGFAESCIFSDNTDYLKIVVNDEDFLYFQNLIGRTYLLGFNAETGTENQVVQKFESYLEENTNGAESLGIKTSLYSDLEFLSGGYLKSLLMIMMVMAIVVLLAVFLMIRHRITNDIGEQVVSIGVLEALGYRSGEISQVYVLEYVILGIGAIILGIFGSLMMNATIDQVGRLMTGHHYGMEREMLPYILTAVLILLFVTATAFFKSRMVRKYPPVLAFRKGIRDHHYGRNILPLEKTRFNVHIRIAMKSFLGSIRENIGVGICIAAATVAIVISFILYTYCDDGVTIIKTLVGLEISGIRVNVAQGADADILCGELEELPEVSQINKTGDWFYLKAVNEDAREQEQERFIVSPVIYGDYEKIGSINPIDGRKPKHDNEVMITKLASNMWKKEIGDTIHFSYGKVKKEFIVTGIVSSLTNQGTQVYFTDAGFCRLKPSYKPDVLEIILQDGVDREEFTAWLTNTYGESIADALDKSDEVLEGEEKIRASAESKMASLLSSYGADHVEYTIIWNGKEISGSSDIFKISSTMSLEDCMVNQLNSAIAAFSVGTRMFMVIAFAVVMIIMFMIMTSSVRKQRGELGVYKGLGYRSGELMFQLTFRLVPVLIAGITLGTIIGIYCIQILSGFIGKVAIDIRGVLLMDVLVFLFACANAFWGGKKIHKISVYELMTE